MKKKASFPPSPPPKTRLTRKKSVQIIQSRSQTRSRLQSGGSGSRNENDRISRILTACPLFEGISAEKTGKLLPCLSPRVRTYAKNSLVMDEGEECTRVGIVASGALDILRCDYWGNRSIAMRIEPGGLFAEAFAAGRVQKMPVSVAAAEKSEVILIDINRILGVCSSACEFHTALIKNMVFGIARKNIELMEKMEHLTGRTTRQKVLSYLASAARRQKTKTLTIPFNRQELADYLFVERSALSRELCRMRSEGIITFRKNTFQLEG